MASEQTSGHSKATESLSQFLARLLDQLSLSSWLPSAIVVATGGFFIALGANGARVDDAAKAVLGIEWSGLAVIVGLTIMLTVLTQAFEFEAVRMLEGYWPDHGRLGKLGRRKCAEFRSEAAKLEAAQLAARMQAARSAQRNLDPTRPDDPIAIGINYFVETGRSPKKGDPPDVYELFKASVWFERADPVLVREYHHAAHLRAQFPALAHRVLPTRLGNLLRSFEDRVHRTDEGNVEGFVQRHLELMPPLLLVEHNQFRSRINLYCTLVFVFLGLSASALLLWQTSWRTAVLASVVMAFLAGISHRAAFASARGYGRVLLSMRDVVDKLQHPATPTNKAPTTAVRA